MKQLGPRALLRPRCRSDGVPTSIEPSSTSSLHCDTRDNVNVLFRGKKKFLLFSPADTLNLYPLMKVLRVVENGEINWSNPHNPNPPVNGNFALVNPSKPDLNLFPNFAKTNPIEIELHGGEMLFLPMSWWHQVTTYSPTLAVNMWYKAPGSLLT